MTEKSRREVIGRSEIRGNLETADIILLLISSDFFASRYCWDVEFKTALEKVRESVCASYPGNFKAHGLAD